MNVLGFNKTSQNNLVIKEQNNLWDEVWLDNWLIYVTKVHLCPNIYMSDVSMPLICHAIHAEWIKHYYSLNYACHEWLICLHASCVQQNHNLCLSLQVISTPPCWNNKGTGSVKMLSHFPHKDTLCIDTYA